MYTYSKQPSRNASRNAGTMTGSVALADRPARTATTKTKRNKAGTPAGVIPAFIKV